MIIALAGRRVDSADAKDTRFPLRNVESVRTRARAHLRQSGATALVSSAACGADLIALSEAGHLGLRRRVILPFERSRFRETSVTDRPGDWGFLYDDVLNAVEPSGDLVILECGSDDEAYAATNCAILDEAVSMGESIRQPVTALLIWNGASRGNGDLTEHFAVEARKRGLPVTEILTV
jgi:hypothetical protein